MRSHRWWKTLLLSLWGLWSCASPSAPPSGVLRIGLFSPYTSLDPIYARDQVSVWLVQQVFAGLVGYDSLLRPVPALAERWEISADGRRYRFFLRKGIPYHGRPMRFFRAQDVVYSWHRLAAPAWASPGSYLFRGIILGWDSYQSGQASHIEGVRAVGDSVVEVELAVPYGPFLHLLTLPYAMVVLPEAAESLGRSFGQTPVGCGPFAVEWHERGRLLVLRRHFLPMQGKGKEAFEGGMEGRCPVQKLVFTWLPNRLWAWEALKRGEIDAFEGTDRALEYLFRRDTLWYRWAYRVETPQLGTEYLGMDVRSGSPLADVRLRRALRALIRQMPLTEVLSLGHATPAQTFIPPALLARIPPQSGAAPDTQALADLRRVSLTLYAAPAYRELCEYLQGRLAQQGLSVQVEYLLGPSLREYLSKGQIHLWKASWLADFPDGENFLVLFESSQCMPAGPNTTRFRHVQMDSLIRAARATPDEEKRRSLYTLAEALLQEEVPVIPLYHAHGIWVVRQGIQRFPRSPLPVWLPLEGVVLPCEATSPNSPLLN